ncbi:MAG: hypothetical protein FJ279_03570 [Planctomycetes bacterium]|nr:hypothetical protein [Planctomycetota bacterium]
MSTTIQTIDERIRAKALSNLDSEIQKCFARIRSVVINAGGDDPLYSYIDTEHPDGRKDDGRRRPLRIDQALEKIRSAVLKEASQRVGEVAVQDFIRKFEETVELAQFAMDESNQGDPT